MSRKYVNRYNTDAKEAYKGPSNQQTPVSILKPSQHSIDESMLSQRNIQFVPFKYLTIKVHEANLFVDVSVFGKMSTYTKIKLGPITWQTNVDKELHMNPKWNEAKTFDILALSQNNKEISAQLGIDQQKRMFQAKDTINYNSAGQSLSNEPIIKVDVMHSSFFQDSEIGSAILRVKDIMKKSLNQDWVSLSNKKEIIGQILVTVAFEYGGEQFAANTTTANTTINTQKKRVDTKTMSRGSTDIRFKKNSMRLNTDAGYGQEFYSSRSPQFRNINKGQSSYSTTRDRSGGFMPSRLEYPSYQSQDFQSHYTQGMPTSAKSKKIRNTRPDDRREIECPDTLITYENNVDINNEEDDEYDNPMNQQKFNNFFNSLDDHNPYENNILLQQNYQQPTNEFNNNIQPIIREDSDTTDCDIPIEMMDEGSRILKPTEYSGDTFKNPTEIQHILDTIKTDNIHIKNKETELKQRFDNLKQEYQKVLKERTAFESRQQALNLRENCLVTEKKNLAIEFENLQQQQEEYKGKASELYELKNILLEAKESEEEEKQKTIELENKIKELSSIHQKENQNLKQLESEMYKRLISQKIQEFSKETYGYSILQKQPSSQQPQAPTILQKEQQQTDAEEEEIKRDIVDAYGLDDQCNLDFILIKLREKSMALEKEVESKIQNIDNLKQIVQNYDQKHPESAY